MNTTLLRSLLLLPASLSLLAAPLATDPAIRPAEQRHRDRAAIYDALQRGDVAGAIGRISAVPLPAGATADAVVARELGSAALAALNRTDAPTAVLAATEALLRLGSPQIAGWPRRSDRAHAYRLRALLLERALGRPEDAAEAWRGVLVELPGDAQAIRALRLIEERARLRRIRSDEIARDPLKPGYRPTPSTTP